MSKENKETTEGTAAGAPETPAFTCAYCGSECGGDPVEVAIGDGDKEDWCEACTNLFARECEHCREPVRNSAAVTVSGEHWCPECVENDAVTCERCGERVTDDDSSCVRTGSRRDGTEENWCQSCVESHAQTCDRCEDLVSRDNTSSVGDSTWCVACADEHTDTCSDCGCRLPSDELTYSESNDGYYCEECFGRLRSVHIYGYHGFPRTNPRFYGANRNSGSLFLGFELEAGKASASGCDRAAKRLSEVETDWARFHLERDGSIPDYGFELISNPHTLAAHQEYDWANVFSLMKAEGLKSHDCNKECGLHVHVSRAFLTGTDCAKIDLFLQRNVSFWEKIARRESNSYAAFKVKKISDCGKARDRYSAVNFCPDRTVEFRLFRGSLKYTTVMATLELCDAVCRWVKTRSCVQILRNKNETGNFVSYVREEKKRYKNAVQYLKDLGLFQVGADGGVAATDPSAEAEQLEV